MDVGMTIFSPQWMISAFFHLRKKPDFFRGCRQLFPKSVNIFFTIDGKSKIILVGIHALYVNTNSIWCVQLYIEFRSFFTKSSISERFVFSLVFGRFSKSSISSSFFFPLTIKPSITSKSAACRKLDLHINWRKAK